MAIGAPDKDSRRAEMTWRPLTETIQTVKSIKVITLMVAVVLTLVMSGCASKARSAPLKQQPTGDRHTRLLIFAAGSLADSFPASGELYENQNPDQRLVFNIAGSHQLASQILQGAPADVFASANWAQMQKLINADFIDAKNVQSFASNSLVIIFPVENQAGIQSIADLAKPGLSLVLGDHAVPVGKYSLEFLDQISQTTGLGPGFKTLVLSNIVSYETNVRSVLNKVLLAEADAGIVYSSDIHAFPAGEIGQIEIPAEFNVDAKYYIAPLNTSAYPGQSQDFINFIRSKDGQALMQQFGFSSDHESE
jgi:molybdate transport system substrate-binding protein